ncbi:MAG: spore germination protein, partial [Oscillospiraceae bacterium]|nr:spore germination protein [Oscillospiraceae bacterium]
HSSEDYYMGNVYATYSRLLRLFSFFASIIAPAAFVAILAFHHEMLPPGLMLTVAASRLNVPLPTAIECFLLLLFFDILREAGIRSPGFVGQAVGFVGGIVIGQAAVEAHLVAAPVVIVVGFVGISVLLVSRVIMANLTLRYGLLLAASLFGLTGLALGLAVLLIHIFNLQSCGIPALLSRGELDRQEVRDTFVRASWPKILTRPAFLSPNHTRSKPAMQPKGDASAKPTDCGVESGR